MCAHNGTHVDGDVTAIIAEEMIKNVKSTDEEATKVHYEL